MKITNKKYVVNFRYIVLSVYFILFTIIIYHFGIISIQAILYLLLILFTITLLPVYREFDSTGECIAFKKYYFLKNGYINPYIEIPKRYVVDYDKKKILYRYYLMIILDSGDSKSKILSVSLRGFPESDIIKIVNTFETIKKNNKTEIEKYLEDLFS